MGNHVDRPPLPASESFGSMWILGVHDFLQLDDMPSHEELQARGLLVQRDPGHFCIFVSHQWLGSSHPDSELVQLPILQSALRKLLAGTTKATSDATCQFMGENRQLPKDQLRKLKNGYIWLDWFSIPQHTFEVDLLNHSPVVESMLRSPTATNQDLFISSIPFYVEVSDVFVALVPHLDHTETKTQCNLKTYFTRGWCRLEMWCSILSASEKPLLVVKGSDEVEFANLMFVNDRPPHEGQLTFESDRPVIYYVMRKALLAKLRILKKNQMWDVYRFTLARYELLLGLQRIQRNLSSFMQDFHFDSLEKAKNLRGLGPLECAILSSNISMIPFLVQAGFDMTRTVLARVNVKSSIQEAHSSLTLALEYSWRTPEVALELLKLRADANRTDRFGLVPLGHCRTSEAVDMLVQYRADVNQTSGPLHLPPLSICCTRCAPPEVIAKLLDYQAEVDHQGRGVGASQPLAALGVFSCLNPNCLEVAELLLNARAHIDSQYPGRGIFKALEIYSRARVRCGSSSALLRFFAELTTTPLGVACYFGGDEYVDFLLEASADPTIKNQRGNTPFQLARGEHVLKIIDKFQTFSV